MSNEPQLFRVNPKNKESERMEEVDFHRLGLQERRDIQEWVAANPGILGDDLLIIGKEFSDFDRTSERLDLLAVDSDGKLVVIELKRDDTGADAHWQAIKYASYLHRASAGDIIRMMSDYTDISEGEAADQLMQHLGADDLNALNNDQRIILASHRFAPEVTSAALWLNEKAPGENLITCVKLTPHRDPQTDSLYIQASTIIPVPGVDEYVVRVVGNSEVTATPVRSSFADKMRETKERNRNDKVTQFARTVGRLTLGKLPDEIRPDKTGIAAGGWEHFRYYNLWYSQNPWRNHRMCYHIHLRPEEESDTWQVDVGFQDEQNLVLPTLDGIQVHEDQKIDPKRIYARIGPDALNDEFANRVAEMLRQFIEGITPIVDELETGD